MSEFQKNDENKPDHSLLPIESVEAMTQVLEYGEKKYTRDNWKKGYDPVNIRRYYSATLRHLFAWFKGEECDPESGLPHLAHAMTNIAIIFWLNKKQPNTPPIQLKETKE